MLTERHIEVRKRDLGREKEVAGEHLDARKSTVSWL
jgi:hypothetical protein